MLSLYFQIKPFCQKKNIGENDQQLLKRDDMCIRNLPSALFSASVVLRNVIMSSRCQQKRCNVFAHGSEPYHLFRFYYLFHVLTEKS